MSKKRVYDKDLGVELHLEEEEDDSSRENYQEKVSQKDRNDPEGRRKRAKIETSQAGSSSVVAESTKLDEDSDSDNFDDIDYGDDEEDNENYINNQIGKYLMEENCCLNNDNEDDNHEGSNHTSEQIGSDDDEVEDADEDHSGGHEEADEEDDSEDREHNQTQQRGANERCKYWPNCNAGVTCSFYHPTKQCRTFPNCRFGQECLYIHPVCKYIPNCTRPGCPFAHPVVPTPPPRPIFPTAPQQAQMPRCKYGFNCKNLMCKFQHNRPEPCRFGTNCLSNNCPYTHPSDAVKKKQTNAFKWTASSS